ncbi:MAG TPA: methylmalonyl Co-A mutase-associated GTPase MeaB [Chloroflexota bacterium]|nr:methylmalonyl Co-A mutase-associated GTPase MeaB [Chloroflexota bacterium]
MAELASAILKGEMGAVARLITRLENGTRDTRDALSTLFPHTGRAFVLGVTGAPGAGKSTLVDGLIRAIRAHGWTVAVLAVDPSSPFSGGAILGDRVRMQAHAQDPGVYIRSMSTRGRLGGLAAATQQAVHVLDAAGYQLIVVETVGVGQSELDIAGAADTVLVVVTPAMGDTVQLMKAGILEIADIFALNKADLEGAAGTLRALRGMVHDRPAQAWSPPIVETQARIDAGMAALWEQILAHQAHLQHSGELTRRREARLRAEVVAAIERGLRTDIMRSLTTGAQFSTVLAAVTARTRDPQSAAQEVLATLGRAS